MRSAKLVLSAAALGVGLLGAAPAAHATDITNPAEHPDPIIVTIDGQTYRDGADTLPGYDDYACTPIPNVQYDFADDEIQYYDGQGDLIKTAHWTEWSRISSYQTWVSQQHDQSPTSATTTSAAAATPAATSTTTTTSAAAAAPAATSPAATGPAATSPASKTTSAASKIVSAAPKTQSSAARTKGSATTTTRRSTRTSPSSRGATSTKPKGTTSSHAKKRGTSPASSAKHAAAATHGSAAAAPTSTRTPAGAPSAAPSAAATAASSTPGPATAPKYKLVSDKGAAGGVADTRPIGVGILVAVFAAACLAFLFGSVRRQKFGRMAS
jgi:hypothetical protein